ncbi:hypothetical protein [uncultured Gimesia sp.]|uniref:hypothetical protein n=1 Tax=uncultured Gimesia sp. TaxID=1678688 RepID=UPI0030DC981E|tara:strand:+ start:55887 stop:56324 length:438 start_codon:yes stop_codon:yes gene_type:complete
MPRLITNFLLRPFAIVLISSIILVGCGGDVGQGVAVSGTVNLDGAPLENGTVSFIGENGSAAAVGQIKSGQFSLSQSANASGIPAGSYKVKVESWKVQPGAVQDDGSFAKGELAIPEKYTKAASSGFTADVGSGGGTFEFNLKNE